MNRISILDCGAVPGDHALQTAAIQSAIDRAYLMGGGTVEIPAGEYHTGDIRLRSNVTLFLRKGAHLCGSQDPMDYFHHREDRIEPLRPEQITDAPYVHLSTIHGETAYEENKKEYRFKRIPSSRWNNALIRAIDAENIAILGEEGAEIDGSNCFDPQGEEEYRGPHGITLFGCRNIRLSGYTIRNTGNWAHNLLWCENISVEQITVLAGHDGFDAAVCRNVSIKNSDFYTGDDCIAGFGNANVCVSGCKLNSSCSAFRFGGTNVRVRDCEIWGPGKYSFRGVLSMEEKRACAPSPETGKGGRSNCLSVFTYYADYSVPIPERPGNILIENCHVRNVDRFLHYNFSGNETWQRYRPLDDITFRDMEAEDIGMPLTAWGDELDRVELRLRDVRIRMREGSGADSLIRAGNFSRITLENVHVENLHAPALIKQWTEGEISLRNVEHTAETDVARTEEDFFCRPI